MSLDTVNKFLNACVKLEELGLRYESDVLLDINCLSLSENDSCALQEIKEELFICRPGAVDKYPELQILWDIEGGLKIFVTHSGEGDSIYIGRVFYQHHKNAIKLLNGEEITGKAYQETKETLGKSGVLRTVSQLIAQDEKETFKGNLYFYVEGV